MIDLVDRLGQARFASNEREHLESAEEQYRFLRDVMDTSRNDVATFTERLFYDAANEYRESGLINQAVVDWPADQELYSALDDLLEQVVREPESFESLNSDDLAECLSLAGTRMANDGSEFAGLAFARLARVEGQRGNLEGAYAAARKFVEGFGQ